MLFEKRDRKDDLRQAMDGLRRIVRGLRLSSSDLERRLGLSVAQLFALQKLGDGEPRSIRRLAAETLTDPSSVSVVVARLVERRLVTRRADRRDHRRAQIALTATGRSLLRRAPEPPQARLLEALHALPPRRLRELAVTLDGLAARLGTGEVSLFFEEAPRRSRRDREGAPRSSRSDREGAPRSSRGVHEAAPRSSRGVHAAAPRRSR